MRNRHRPGCPILHAGPDAGPGSILAPRGGLRGSLPSPCASNAQGPAERLRGSAAVWSAASGRRSAPRPNRRNQPRRLESTQDRRREAPIPAPHHFQAKERAIASDGNQDVSASSLNKVRDILFGEQAKASEKKIGTVERKLAKDLQDLRKDLLKRLDSLEAYTNQELEASDERFAESQGESSTFQKEVKRQIAELSKTLEQKTTQLDRAIRELRQQILDQSKGLRDELGAKAEELSAEIDAEVEELREVKIDRVALSALFADLAVKLGDKKSGKK